MLSVLDQDVIDDCVKHGTAYDCVGDAGSIVVMRPLLLHSSSEMSVAGPRRILQLDFAEMGFANSAYDDDIAEELFDELDEEFLDDLEDDVWQEEEDN